MNFYLTNPLADQRWDHLLARHALASAFHQRGWLQALSRTYGYKPLVLTSATDSQSMSDGIVFCRVSSWITGTRMVSLPFSDHCEPLLNNPQDLPEFVEWLRAERDSQRWKYVELRPLAQIRDDYGTQPTQSYCFHELDLSPGLELLFRNLHKGSIQRKIQRAEREQLSYVTGQSETLADAFYRLMLRTRRRHHLLPQPRAWFRNLVECMGDNAQIRVAAKNGIPVAAMLTLSHGSSVIYKYGCSDERHHNLGAMPFLFWKLIEESKASGAEKIDFGRSDLDQESLIAFKDKFGATRKLLHYYRYPQETKHRPAAWGENAIRQCFSMLPDSVSSTAGRLVYRHMG